MSAFVVLPLSHQITAEVRASRRAPVYGHPVHEELAGGTGPCRECLRPFVVGAEDRLLFTYSPFDGQSTLPQPGPVFIHATSCSRHDGVGFPEGLRSIPLVAQAYHRDGTVGAPVALPVRDQDAVLDRALGVSSVTFLLLRHAEAGCFIARVQRVA
jgi:hypothetical protein